MNVRNKISKSLYFLPLQPIWKKLSKTNWPQVEDLNKVLLELPRKIKNYNNQEIQFVLQKAKPTNFHDSFEARTFEHGQILVRPNNWHDLFNAIIWMTFPKSKAIVNKLNYLSLIQQKGLQRSKKGDALTLFDEDGIIVFSKQKHLMDLIINFQWEELFWNQRDAIQEDMCFVIFGHALYEKMLEPRIGITGKGVLISQIIINNDDFLDLNRIDTAIADHLLEPTTLKHGKDFCPLPVLGIPGWFSGNDKKEFYGDLSYFRPGRNVRNL